MSSRRAKQKSDIASTFTPQQSKLINFLSIVGGATFTLVVIFYLISFLLGTNIEEPIADPKFPATKMDRLDPIEPTSPGSGTTTPDFGFENQVAVSKVEELADLLLSMERQATGSAVPVIVQNQRKRIRVADQILMLDHTPEQFQLAVKAKINALSTIYNTWLDVGLSDSDNIEQLYKTTVNYRNDSNLSIRRQARLSFFSLDIIESARIKTEDQDLQKLVKDFYDMIESFPDDQETYQSLPVIFRSAIKTNRRFGLELIREIVQSNLAPSVSTSAESQRLLRELRDEMEMTARDFRRMLPGSIRGQAVSIDELSKTALELIRIPEAGELVMMQVTFAATSLEQEGATKEAETIYQAMVDIASEKSLPEISDSFRNNGQRGLTRIKALGNQLQIQGTLLDGKPLLPAEFENKWSILIFWAAGSQDGTRDLANHLRALQKLENQELKVLVLIMNQNPQTRIGELTNQFPEVYFAVADQPNPDRPSILEQFPANIVPQAVVLNPNGILVRSNLPLKGLETEIELLIAK